MADGKHHPPSLRRTAALLSAAFLALALAASSGLAQGDHSTVVRVLRESRDFRARVRAALALGQTSDHSVTPYLVSALRDRSPAVRAAAATALGQLRDRSAIGPLRALSHDSARVVRSEAERAIRRIRAGSRPVRPSAPARALTRTASGGVLPAIAVVPRARDIYWPTVRYVVVLGNMENRSNFHDAGLDALLEREVTRNLIVLRGVAVLPGDRVPATAEREIARRRLPELRLEGSLNRVDRRAQPRQISVRCEVSLMLMDEPGRNLRGVLNGAATGSQPRRGHREEQERQLAEQALTGAVHSAMSGAARAIASASL
jgi:hypothetical protein